MDASLAKKTCKICCMEMPEQARKRPHCHHFQNRWTLCMTPARTRKLRRRAAFGLTCLGRFFNT
jgi:hypothetical protein